MRINKWKLIAVVSVISVALLFTLSFTKTTKSAFTREGGTLQFTNLEVTFLDSGPFTIAPGAVEVRNLNASFPENRVIVGWMPWMGFARGGVLEGHILLLHGTTQLFLRGPHKENPSVYYDVPQAMFFPAGTGRIVPAGETITVQVLASNTGTSPTAAHGNARIFTVPLP